MGQEYGHGLTGCSVRVPQAAIKVGCGRILIWRFDWERICFQVVGRIQFPVAVRVRAGCFFKASRRERLHSESASKVVSMM